MAATAAVPGARPELVALFRAAQAIAEPAEVDGIPDYSADAIMGRRAELEALRSASNA